MTVDLDEYDPPDRPDFRRIGKGIPYVLDPEGKRTRYSRSSNGGKILDDESNLTDWKLRTVVVGAAQRPELMAKASVLDPDRDKKALRDIAESCIVAGRGERRSVIGTAVHAMFDHIDREDAWSPPPNFTELCAAYVDMKTTWGFVAHGIELHCISDRWRLAGTLDRRYRTTKVLVAPDGQVIPIGTIVVADHKTGKELEYAAGSYSCQLAAYVDSVEYDVVTDERTPFDPPNFPDWALIIHADSSGTRVDVYWVDIEAGRKGLALADEVKAWRRRDDLLTMARLGLVAHQAPAPDVPALPAVALPAGPDVPGRIEYLRGRARAVLDHSEVAAKALQRAWPVGVAGLKQGGQSWDELDRVEAAIVKVEADFSVPFYEPFSDRGIQDSMSRHPSNDHPRRALLKRWADSAALTYVEGVSDLEGIRSIAKGFADLPVDEFNDDDVETLLDGSLRAIGVDDLGKVVEGHSALLLSLLFAIGAGNAKLLFDEQGNPIVRVIS